MAMSNQKLNFQRQSLTKTSVIIKYLEMNLTKEVQSRILWTVQNIAEVKECLNY